MDPQHGLLGTFAPGPSGRPRGASWIKSTACATFESWRFPQGTDSSVCAEAGADNTAFGSTISIVSAFIGSVAMPTKSKSRTTTKRNRARGLVARRLPRRRPPTHPGEMLLEEFLKPLEISQSAFAIRLGVSFPRLNEVIRGKRAVTPDTALRLARVLGMSADFWLGLQQDWDLWHAMRSEKAAEIEQLKPMSCTA